MANRIQVPLNSVTPPKSGFVRTVLGPLEPYVQGDAIPVPDVIEKDSESVWALWSDAVEGSPRQESDGHPATQIMGLDELPKEADR